MALKTVRLLLAVVLFVAGALIATGALPDTAATATAEECDVPQSKGDVLFDNSSPACWELYKTVCGKYGWPSCSVFQETCADGTVRWANEACPVAPAKPATKTCPVAGGSYEEKGDAPCADPALWKQCGDGEVVMRNAPCSNEKRCPSGSATVPDTIVPAGSACPAAGPPPNECPQGQEMGWGGRCEPSKSPGADGTCPNGKEKYGNTCVDPCPAGQQRDAGVCHPPCPPGQEYSWGQGCAAPPASGQQESQQYHGCQAWPLQPRKVPMGTPCSWLEKDIGPM